jgi:DNA-binding YbaB/EbfC family protein
MQAQLQERRAALAQRTFTGTAGGGAVTVVLRGSGELESVSLDPAVLDPADPEMVGDLVVAAVNLALRQLQEEAASGLGLEGFEPEGFDASAIGLDDLRGLLG